MVTYEYALDAGYILIRRAGADAPAEIEVLLHELARDAILTPGARLLIDVRESAHPWTVRQLDAVVPAFRLLAGRGVSAIAIVADADVAYGMARILAVHLDTHGLEARVFRALEPAEQWLEQTGTSKP
ncbi:MAG TPA: hypothetical protein VFN83_02690 [Gemmatimonadales bacterium]|jgi:hypothetical protein|nr:hypothetical protein [Gemmatimonadales bacterium]